MLLLRKLLMKSINLANAGDMNKSTYDTDNNNKVDDAELVNGLSVETAVQLMPYLR